MTDEKQPFAYVTKQVVEASDSIEYGPTGKRIKLFFTTAEELDRKMAAINAVVDKHMGAGQ